MSKETFTKNQVLNAIEAFLKYGEDQYLKSQQGYFSGPGWAARCLRFHQAELDKSPWIKVSDQEPPKDENWFLVRGGSLPSRDYYYHIVRWAKGVEEWDIKFGDYFKNFREDNDWMPIPE